MESHDADVAALNTNWPAQGMGAAMESVEHAFRVNVSVGGQVLVADTHLFGSEVNVIPYDNSDDASDVDGETIGRGDAVIAQYFTRGEIGIAVKHHRPEFRFLDLENANAAQMKEDFKLQDTHIEIVVGVERDGQAGAITLKRIGHPKGQFRLFGHHPLALEPSPALKFLPRASARPQSEESARDSCFRRLHRTPADARVHWPSSSGSEVELKQAPTAAAVVPAGRLQG